MTAASRRVVVLTIAITSITYAVAGAAAVGFWELQGFSRRLPSLALTTGPQSTVVFDRHNRPVFRFHTEDRSDVAFDQISPHMIHAILAVEDKRFYSHHGLDALRIVRAAMNNLRAGHIVEGASTVTQQLARSMLLTQERTYRRKLREVFLASQIEERYDKRAILEAYLNRVYFGNGYYGVEAASRGYFGKTAADLTAAEAALLAGLVNSPRRYSPTAAPERARARRNLVLRLMHEQGKLRVDDVAAAAARPLVLLARRAEDLHREAESDDSEPCGLYFKEEVRRVLTARVGTEALLTGGLRVYTTIDMDLQCEAERVVNQRLAELRQINRRANDPDDTLQASLITLDPRSGFVLAMVGGSDFHLHRYNRATQAHRQPGSAFKPFVFAAAIEQGYAPFDIIGHLDRPIDAAGREWLPGGEHEAGPYTLRRALKVSSNRASAQLMQEVGVTQTIALSHHLGIESPLPAVPSLALGTGEVTLLELTAAYSAFANGGFITPATMIRRVESRDGATLWQNESAPKRAVSQATAFLVTSMLQDVVTGGTAASARAFGFSKPAAGKTGTTDSYADAWFIGYTPRLITGVWFGFDRPATIMNRGFASTVAVPAWARFMAFATRQDPAVPFPQPPDVERVAICRVSGMRATDACRRAGVYVTAHLDANGLPSAPPVQEGVDEDFAAAGSVPSETCSIHAGAAVAAAGIRGTSGDDVIASMDAAPVAQQDPMLPGRIVIEHERSADGIVRTILRQVPAGVPRVR